MAATKARSTRLDAAGNIYASPGGLSSLTINNPTSGALTVKVNDATTGETDEKLQVTVPAYNHVHMNWTPPLECLTGIRLGTVGDGLIITGAYVD